MPSSAAPTVVLREVFLMRVFITGASGWIGSAVVPELLGAGHRVIGFRRAAPSADAQTVAS
jgi:nucleoside-diphosphate-sugar epimerase